jgi:hypothetical protein
VKYYRQPFDFVASVSAAIVHVLLPFRTRLPGLANTQILAWGSATIASPMFNCLPGAMLTEGYKNSKEERALTAAMFLISITLIY